MTWTAFPANLAPAFSFLAASEKGSYIGSSPPSAAFDDDDELW